MAIHPGRPRGSPTQAVDSPSWYCDAMELPILTRVLSTAAVLIIGAGLVARRNRRVHVPLMLTAGLVDLVNVALVEYHARASRGRGAVEQGLSALLQGDQLLREIHVAVSSLCVVSFLVALVTGWRLLRRGRSRAWHRTNAIVFVALRLVSYGTSFWM